MNMYDAPAGDSNPAGIPEPDAPQYRPAPEGPRKNLRLLRWGAGITLAGFLAGGGIALAASSGGTPAAAANTAEATQLSSALSTASNTTATASAPRVTGALRRLRLLRGIDGEFTYQNKKGVHTLAFERGTISSVSGSDVVVHAADGTTWTWLIVSDTVVRESGKKTSASALSDGETIFVGGPVVSGTKDARLIAVRKAASSGSDSGKTSSSAKTSVS